MSCILNLCEFVSIQSLHNFTPYPPGTVVQLWHTAPLRDAKNRAR